MRILLLIPYFYPSLSFGGPVKVAFDAGKELVKQGHEVVVFASDAMDWENRLDFESSNVEGMEVHYLRNTSMFLVKTSNLFLTPVLFKKLKMSMKSFDVVHAHEYTTFQNIVLHHFARKYGVPYIIQAHGSLLKIGRVFRKWSFDAFFGSKLLKDASKVLALNQTEAMQYLDMGVSKEKIEILPNGIDLLEYGDLPVRGDFKKKFGIDENEKLVLFLGRIHETKGLKLLADAFSVVARNIPNVKLVIIGPDDGYKKELSSTLSDLGLTDNVLFTGFIAKRDKFSALFDSEVFVTPHFYGFPVTFLESCLACCPIVTASNELDWINNNVGYVTASNPESVAKGIMGILQDEQTSKRFRENCHRMIKNFEISAIARQLERIYSEVAA